MKYEDLESRVSKTYSGVAKTTQFDPATIAIIINLVMTIVQGCIKTPKVLARLAKRPVLARVVIRSNLSPAVAKLSNVNEIVETVAQLGDTATATELTQITTMELP